MTSDDRAASKVRPVDGVAVERTRRRLEEAPEAPWLHQEAARRMAERLPLMRRQPRRVLDVWPKAGGSVEALSHTLPQARVDRLDAQATAGSSGPWWHPGRWLQTGRSVSVATAEPGAYDMLWANMLLQHVVDPAGLMAGWHADLAEDGFLMFSTLGPGSLGVLRGIYGSMGWGPPLGPLVDMHDLGDLLVEAGFADPVMDQEIVRLTWGDASDALIELRTLGANVSPMRHQGLRTPRWLLSLLEALTRAAARTGDQRIEMEFELVYGHAFKPAHRLAVSAEARISVDEMRRSLQRSRPQRSA